jgi:transposase-like protein
MPAREYTDAEKAAALAFYAANGNNLKRTARECNLPTNTLRRWVEAEQEGRKAATPATPKKEQPRPLGGSALRGRASPAELAELAEDARFDLGTALDEKIQMLVGAMTPSLIADGDLKAVTIALGTLIDKRVKLREVDWQREDRERERDAEEQEDRPDAPRKIIVEYYDDQTSTAAFGAEAD